MTTNRSAPPGPIVPTLVYEDVGKAVAWLCDAFGFTETRRWGAPDDFTVQLAVGGGSVLVFGPRVGHGSAGRLSFRPPRSDELSHALMVQTDDVDDRCGRAMRAGADILLEPETYRFGERQFSVRDLGGHVWTFTESVADVDPAEWAGAPS